MIPRILIAGIGNILLQDDGLGPQAISRLQAEYNFGDEVELLDIGTPTLDFVDYLRGREIVIVIDALGSGGEPGEVLTFNKDQLEGVLPNMRLSAHQPCLNETLHTAKTAGIDLKGVLLVGVVGYSFEVGTELGPYVSRAMPEILELIVDIVRQHGINVQKRAIVEMTRSWWEADPLVKL